MLLEERFGRFNPDKMGQATLSVDFKLIQLLFYKY